MFLSVFALCFLLAGCSGDSSEILEPFSDQTTEQVSASEVSADQDTEIHPESEMGSIEKKENLNEEDMIIYVTINDSVLTAVLNENSSAEALIEKLEEEDITVEMHDFSNFEKVGLLGFDLPRNDESITTKAGDIILYQGDQIVFYYDTNFWSFTKLGEFQDVTAEELRDIFGDGNITATLSLQR